MSAYLSPIMSSGDLTPPQLDEQNKQQQQQPLRPEAMGEPEAHLAAGKLASKLRQNKLKSQQQQQQPFGIKRMRAGSSSILLDDSASSDEERVDQVLVARAGDQERERQQNENKRPVGGWQASGRRQQTLAEQFMQAQQSAFSLHYKDDEDDDDEEDDDYDDDESRAHCIGGPAGTNNCAKNCGHQPAPGSGAHLRLAAGRGSLSGPLDSAPGSSSSGLLGGGGARLNKKFKQILQSIPTVPTLVATTSIMTLLLLLGLLLLSDTPRATALRELPPSDHFELEQQGERVALTTGGQPVVSREQGEEGSQQQEPGRPVQLRAPAPSQAMPEKERGAELKFLLSEPAEASAAGLVGAAVDSRQALRRELINDLLLAPANQRRTSHQAAGRQPPGRLPPQMARVRSSSKRNGGASELEAAGAEPKQAGAGQANLFDSLGAMLFGAVRQAEAGGGEQPETGPAAAAYLDGEPAAAAAVLSAMRPVGGKPAPVDSAEEHRPAHLRSSALELELGPEQTENSVQSLGPSQPAGGQRARHKHHSHNSQIITNNNQNNQNNHNHNSQQQHQQQQSQQQWQPQADEPEQQQQHEPANSESHARDHERAFDVAQIQCNNTEEGFERFACPTPDFLGRYRCIEDRLFCDGYYDCPGGEDEDRAHCMYYRLFVSHIDILTNTLITWMKNQNRQGARGSQSATPGGHQQHLSSGLALDT